MRTVLITGVSRGIGKALAERFLKEGYFVIGTSTSGQSPLFDPNLQMFQLDLSKPESIEKCASEIMASGRKIDVLINNAGALFDDDETILDTDKLRKTLEVNLVGTVDFTEKLISFVNTGGHIINVSSSAGSLASVHKYYYPAYKISKAALNMYTRTLALRLESEGITVSSVHPGWVRTDMGGDEAPMSPDEAADHIFQLATSKVETGQFWFKGEKFPW